MATCSFLLSHVPINGSPPRKSNPATSHFSERYKFEATRRIAKPDKRVSGSTLCCMLGASPSVEFPPLDTKPLEKILELRVVAEDLKIDSSELSHVASDFIAGLVLADLDAATAKIAIGILGPSLSAFGFLFIARIVMSWYPNIPVGKFPYVIAYAPTEPLLVVTRKLIPPLGGVDVTPVVWFGLVSFLNEILVGPQGLLVLLSQQINQ